MSLIENLNAINDCKDAIKESLIGKGVDMTNVKFADYATKIDELQLASGDTPSTPAPSADYVYSNANLCDAEGNLLVEESDIINFTPYEIELVDGKYIMYVSCPEEIPGYEGGTYYDIILTVDVPTTYRITNFELYAEGLSEYVNQPYKANPRHTTVERNGVTYNSYVRQTLDGLDIASADVQYEPLQYRITIEK